MHDANTVRRIVAASGIGPDDVVLEVGPGLGSLTLALLAEAGRVVAVEIDPKLADRLPRTIAERAPGQADRFEVITADAMSVSRADLPEPTALVANLPFYNVAVPVLLHLMAELPSIRTALVMVQAESPTGWPQTRWPNLRGAQRQSPLLRRRGRAGAVGRNVFWPEPKVESGLVRIRRTAVYPADDGLRKKVFEVIDAAFAQRRKTMRSALAGWAGSAAEAERRLRAAGIDPQIRGEKLSVADFVRSLRCLSYPTTNLCSRVRCVVVRGPVAGYRACTGQGQSAPGVGPRRPDGYHDLVTVFQGIVTA